MADLRTELIQCDTPSNPNLPVDMTTVRLQSLSLWAFGPIPTILVFPGTIDLLRLQEAIKVAGGAWPTVAGRYVASSKEDTGKTTDFAIELSNSLIPLTIQSIESDAAFQDLRVLQPSLAPYLPPMPAAAAQPNTDTPLLTIRLTTLLPSNRAVLGFQWSHIIGDASACHRFISLLSLLYEQGDNLIIPLERYPNFGPHVKLPSDSPTREAVSKYDITQYLPRKMDTAIQAYRHDADKSEAVTVELSRAELGILKVECQALSKAKLSDQDVISAWWMRILQEVDVDIKRVIYATNYRSFHNGHPAFPAELPNLSSSVALFLPIHLESSQAKDPLRIQKSLAETIRAGLSEFRQSPDETLACLSVLGKRLNEAAEEGAIQLSLPGKGEAIVNSNLRYDWIIPFGHPASQTTYHTSWTAMNNLRVFEANLKPGQAVGQGGVELSFGVNKQGGIKGRVETIMTREREKWGAMLKA